MATSGNKLSAIQQKLLPMLKWYHAFCEENGLRYFALGGTMLGAARHQGFIPWDDDIDVGMPRKDYNKFVGLCKEKRFDNYTVESIDSDNSDFFYGYTKIYDITTTLVEHTKGNIKRGIYIDVFPLDGIPQNEIDRWLFIRRITKKHRLLLARTCGYRKGRSFYKNLAIFAAQMIPDTIINDKKLMREIDSICQTYDYDSCDTIGNMLGNWGKREIMPKQIMGKPTQYIFEDTTIWGAEDYDGYLISLYDNWRKLPPADKRITHHDFVFIDLQTSYLN